MVPPAAAGADAARAGAALAAADAASRRWRPTPARLLDELVLHAAMTAPIEPIERPTIVASLDELTPARAVR